MQAEFLPGGRRVGFYPGTFDPFTIGHRDITLRALAQFDELVVGVALSAAKRPLLSLDERCSVIEQTLLPLCPGGKTFRVVGFDTLMIEAARKEGAHCVIRGLRSSADFETESQMAAINRQLAPELETMFLTAREEHRLVASRIVRELLAFGGDINPYVPANIARLLLSKAGKRPT
ncbi:pantetheine-phosphate adenylyltransferase [Asaia sp. VD9]|uniref:pantetheine-phosphate adenylyltransferase n=1 Tax=Asaia sp. VD9 TaxID=3081235 RepID=UPI003016AD2B